MKNDPTGKAHATVTKTTSNHGASSTELQTPKNFLSGLSGVLSDCAANDSASGYVGSGPGGTSKTQSSRPGVDGALSLKPSKSSSQNFGH